MTEDQTVAFAQPMANTGVPQVDEILQELAGVDECEPAQQLERFQQAYQRLQSLLSDAALDADSS